MDKITLVERIDSLEEKVQNLETVVIKLVSIVDRLAGVTQAINNGTDLKPNKRDFKVGDKVVFNGKHYKFEEGLNDFWTEEEMKLSLTWPGTTYKDLKEGEIREIESIDIGGVRAIHLKDGCYVLHPDSFDLVYTQF